MKKTALEESPLGLMRNRLLAERIWQTKYEVGGEYKGFTIVRVDRTKHMIEVSLPDGTNNWINLSEEFNELVNQSATKKTGDQ